MGLDYRDYMRERHRKNFDRTIGDRANSFTPPKEGTSLLVMVAWWVVVAYALYVGYGWLQQRQRNERLARPKAIALANQEHPGAHVDQPPPVQPTPKSHETRSASPEHRQPVPNTFSDTNSSAEREPASAPSTGGTIYLCKSYDGGTFWASSHCSNHKALIDRMASVPPAMSFEQQVQIAQQRRSALEQSVYVAPTPTTQVADAGAAHRAECKALDARVEQLDAMARQPQSAQMQDWIRGERKVARDRQFTIRC